MGHSRRGTILFQQPYRKNNYMQSIGFATVMVAILRHIFYGMGKCSSNKQAAVKMLLKSSPR